MIIMVANNSGSVAKKLAKSGKLGNLYSPKSQQKPISNKWALDNGRFITFKNNSEWSFEDYEKLLIWASHQKEKPLWALVPDVVMDKEKTISEFYKYLPLIQKYDFIPAFAVQDGMLPVDVPLEAKVIFIGGSTKWKWETLHIWSSSFDRVHVGRVNGRLQLQACLLNGVESVDGTGWFRGCKRQLNTLIDYCSNRPIGLFDFKALNI